MKKKERKKNKQEMLRRKGEKLEVNVSNGLSDIKRVIHKKQNLFYLTRKIWRKKKRETEKENQRQC